MQRIFTSDEIAAARRRDREEEDRFYREIAAASDLGFPRLPPLPEKRVPILTDTTQPYMVLKRIGDENARNSRFVRDDYIYYVPSVTVCREGKGRGEYNWLVSIEAGELVSDLSMAPIIIPASVLSAARAMNEFSLHTMARASQAAGKRLKRGITGMFYSFSDTQGERLRTITVGDLSFPLALALAEWAAEAMAGAPEWDSLLAVEN